MAATPVAIFLGESSGTSSVTIAVTVGSGEDVVVHAISRDSTGGANYASATWNGGGVTADESGNGTLAENLQTHRLRFIGLSAGSHNLVITFSASLDHCSAWARTFTGLHATTAFGDIATTNTTAAGGVFDGGTLTVDCASGDVAIGLVRVRADVVASMTVNGGAGAFVDGPQLADGNTIAAVNLTGSPDVTSTYAWTTTFNPWLMELLQLIAAAGASPATLSSATPSGTLGTATTATLGATTDQATGTIYGVVDTAGNISGINATQVKAGQNNASSPAVASNSSAVGGASPTTDVSGLTAATAYSYAVVQNNTNGDSNVLTGTFTTAAATPNPGNRNFGPSPAVKTLLTM